MAGAGSSNSLVDTSLALVETNRAFIEESRACDTGMAFGDARE